MPIVLVSKAKPQDCDALPVFKKARRMFLGYPLCRKGYDPQALCRCLINPVTCPDERWREAVEGETNRRMHSRYRNIIHEVEQARESGAIAMIPRPREGAAYVARMTGPFEIVDAPLWGKDYLELRERTGAYGDDEDHHHVADVAQGWPVDEYRRIKPARMAAKGDDGPGGRASTPIPPARPRGHRVCSARPHTQR